MTADRPPSDLDAVPAGAKRGWDEVLDELEHALATGDTWTPPDGLPALPARLLERAEGLLARQQAAQEELAAERDRVGAELSSPRRPTRTRGAAPATGSALSL